MSRTRPTRVTSRSTTSTRASWDEQPAKASTSTTQRRPMLFEPDRNDPCLEGTPVGGYDGACAPSYPLFRDPALRLLPRERIAKEFAPLERVSAVHDRLESGYPRWREHGAAERGSRACHWVAR